MPIETIVIMIVAGLMLVYSQMMITRNMQSAVIFKVLPLTCAVALLWAERAPIIVWLAQ